MQGTTTKNMKLFITISVLLATIGNGMALPTQMQEGVLVPERADDFYSPRWFLRPLGPVRRPLNIFRPDLFPYLFPRPPRRAGFVPFRGGYSGIGKAEKGTERIFPSVIGGGVNVSGAKGGANEGGNGGKGGKNTASGAAAGGKGSGAVNVSGANGGTNTGGSGANGGAISVGGTAKLEGSGNGAVSVSGANGGTNTGGNGANGGKISVGGDVGGGDADVDVDGANGGTNTGGDGANGGSIKIGPREENQWIPYGPPANGGLPAIGRKGGPIYY
ncbi:hypothetical protein GALMADRAFT_159649 [Galerina marginata CBS 339.88]|uniref:Uncharacterized protein n=1 Tax=Galerina marginata (strain CBS 339.88) TaxID=685588 RepID=A0A067SJS6_GALM3|nr:hypothetical protein GALMADRAFT_159649 [Galerina marginata CBS 339.88]